MINNCVAAAAAEKSFGNLNQATPTTDSQQLPVDPAENSPGGMGGPSAMAEHVQNLIQRVDANDARISQMEREMSELRSSMRVTMRVVDGLRDHIQRSGGQVPSPLNIPLPPLPSMPPSRAPSPTHSEILPVPPPSARPVTPLFLPSSPDPSCSRPESLPPSQPSHSGSHLPTPALPTIIVDEDVAMTDIKPVRPAEEPIEILSDSSGPNDSGEEAPGPPAVPLNPETRAMSLSAPDVPMPTSSQEVRAVEEMIEE